MKISEMITDKYKLRIPPTVYYELLADVQEVEAQEPTTKNDLGVDWDELKRKILMEVDSGTDDKWLRYADVCDNISDSIDEFKADLPSVTPQEPKTGYWIPTYGNVECSVCGSVKDSREVGKATHYCDFCGAKMVEPQKRRTHE